MIFGKKFSSVPPQYRVRLPFLLMWLAMMAFVLFGILSSDLSNLPLNQYLPLVQPESVPAPTEETSETPPATAAAEKHFGSAVPRETVLEIISKLKETQDPVAVLDYVWWEAAYQRLDENQKRHFYVKSAPELRQRYLEHYTNPRMFLLRQAERDLSALPPAKRDAMTKFIAEQEKVQLPSPKYTQVLDQLFEIKAERVTGNDAEVDLIVSEKGAVKKQKIDLVKVQDRWLLKCMQIIEDPLRLCEAKSD